MKTIVWALSFGTTLVMAFGQCDSEFSPRNGWQDVSVETIGGITYLKISYQTSCPWILGKQPAVIQGTNVMQRLSCLLILSLCVPLSSRSRFIPGTPVL
jgi:hypothetical protein